jgi:hypothetical protein
LFVQDNKKSGAQSGGSGGCQVQVTADVLNVRSAPNGTAKIVAQINNGAIKPATPTIQNNYRELAQNQWADNQYLKPVSGSC